MTKETRKTKLINIVGTNGTGKTTLANEFIKKEIAKGGRALIVTPDDTDWLQYARINIYNEDRIENFNGAMRHIWKDKEDLKIISRFKNGLLIFDDCRAYFSSILNDDLHKLLIRRRQKQIDILAVAHGFTEIPPKFFTFSTEIIIFKTTDNVIKRRNDIKRFDEVQKMSSFVNQRSYHEPHFYTILKY